MQGLVRILSKKTEQEDKIINSVKQLVDAVGGKYSNTPKEGYYLLVRDPQKRYQLIKVLHLSASGGLEKFNSPLGMLELPDHEFSQAVDFALTALAIRK